jgi:hypothetical protein
MSKQYKTFEEWLEEHRLFRTKFEGLSIDNFTKEYQLVLYKRDQILAEVSIDTELQYKRYKGKRDIIDY